MEIPLFPLHTVLCPGIVLPLHIFEDRYRALTRHCLDTGAPFGVVLIRDGREVGADRSLALAGVGALVEIREAGRYPDGRYDLLAAATGRFAIDTVDQAREPSWSPTSRRSRTRWGTRRGQNAWQPRPSAVSFAISS